jgi:hypothetical protein
MSHLIIEQGKEVGKEVVVPPAGMKFGRSPANDLVLEDEVAMLFHGRFFFKSDGLLWVTDFGAGEKTLVGGLPVDEHQLSTGDLVSVGSTAFRIINTSVETPAAAPVVPVVAAVTEAESSSDDIDLGFKREKKSREGSSKQEGRKSASMSSRIMQVVVIVLVLVVLVIVGPSLSKMSSNNQVDLVEQKDTLTLSYERVLGTSKNIFRYHVELDDKGNFSVKIDDLKTNRHQTESQQISDAVLAQLSHGIESAGFFDEKSDHAGISEDQYDLYNLAVQRNQQFHHIRVLNWTPPSAIKRTTQLIEDLAISELGISFTWMKEPEELMQLAKGAFEIGEARYAERDVRYGNLASSVSYFKETMLYLEIIEPKPLLYKDAEKALEIATAEQDKRYKDYMFRADRAIRLRNRNDAAKYLRILLELIQDRSDPRYDKISAKLLNIEQHLK